MVSKVSSKTSKSYKICCKSLLKKNVTVGSWKASRFSSIVGELATLSERSSLQRLRVQIPRVAAMRLASWPLVLNERLRIVPNKMAQLKINRRCSPTLWKPILKLDFPGKCSPCMSELIYRCLVCDWTRHHFLEFRAATEPEVNTGAALTSGPAVVLLIYLHVT